MKSSAVLPKTIFIPVSFRISLILAFFLNILLIAFPSRLAVFAKFRRVTLPLRQSLLEHDSAHEASSPSPVQIDCPGGSATERAYIASVGRARGRERKGGKKMSVYMRRTPSSVARAWLLDFFFTCFFVQAFFLSPFLSMRG